MVRALSLLGMGGGFLLISPPLRATVTGGMASIVTFLERYSPGSYIVLGIVLVMGLLTSFTMGSRPR